MFILFSSPHPAEPVKPNFVRADLLLGGYHFKKSELDS